MKKLLATLKDIFTAKDDPKKKKQKLLIIIVSAVIAALIIGGVVFAVVMANSEPVDVYLEQLELGEKYVADGEYDKAIVAFEAAISAVKDDSDKNKKLEDVYYLLAEVYNELDELDEAKRVLAEGIEKTGSEKLCDLYEEYFGEPYKADDETEEEETTAEETTAEETTAEETTAEETTVEETTAEETWADTWYDNSGAGGGGIGAGGYYDGNGSVSGGGGLIGSGSGDTSNIPSGDVPVPQAASTKDAFPEYIKTKSGKVLVHTYSDRAVDSGEDNSTNYTYMPMLSTTTFPSPYEEYNNPKAMIEDIRPGLIYSHVMVGYDGYMFYEDTLEDFLGLNFLNGSVYDRAVTMLESSQQWAAQNGKKFYIVIAPNKNTVYPDYMPDGYNIASYRRYDQFVELINDAGITAVDLRGVMAQAVQAYPQQNLYYKYDTHWNNHAGYIAYKRTMEMVKQDFPNAVLHQKSEYQINYVETYMKDQAYYFGQYSYYKDYGPVYTLKSSNTAVLVDAYNPGNTLPGGQFIFAYEATSGRDNGYSDKYKWIQYRNDANTSAPNAYILRDSYSIAMIPFFKDSFHLSTYNWTFNLNSCKSEIKSTKSDVIIAIIAERNLKNYVNQKEVHD